MCHSHHMIAWPLMIEMPIYWEIKREINKSRVHKKHIEHTHAIAPICIYEYVCMYVYEYGYMCVYQYVCMHGHVWIRMYVSAIMYVYMLRRGIYIIHWPVQERAHIRKAQGSPFGTIFKRVIWNGGLGWGHQENKKKKRRRKQSCMAMVISNSQGRHERRRRRRRMKTRK